MCIASLIDIFQALLTPLIAIIVVYISYQQWKTNRQKLNWEMYSRRLHIYEEVKKIISNILGKANANPQDLMAFQRSVSEADFLFNTEIRKYIDEIYKRGLNLWRWNTEYRDHTQEQPENYNHKQVVEEKHKELSWFAEQPEFAIEKFKEYLNPGK